MRNLDAPRHDIKMSVVKGIGEYVQYWRVQRFARLANQAERKHFALNCRQCVFVSG